MSGHLFDAVIVSGTVNMPSGHVSILGSNFSSSFFLFLFLIIFRFNFFHVILFACERNENMWPQCT